MDAYILFIVGIVCAGFGGEFFVRGIVGFAHWGRISPAIIGATIAAFGTSSPELSVSINSALAKEPQIALGDALGSNVLNVALILTLALMLSTINVSRESIKRDFPVALFAPLLTAILIIDGELSQRDGMIMLTVFGVWLLSSLLEAHKQRSHADENIGEVKKKHIIFSSIIGFVLLLLAGKLIVFGARNIAISLGIDEFIIGAIIVAIGTSIPELATTLIAKWRGHDDVSLGTILGSNIFNGLFIVAIAAIICPIRVELHIVLTTLVFGFLTVGLTYPIRDLIERKKGVMLLVIYVLYLLTLFYYETQLNTF